MAGEIFLHKQMQITTCAPKTTIYGKTVVIIRKITYAVIVTGKSVYPAGNAVLS